jgi:hypothetical protein
LPPSTAYWIAFRSVSVRPPPPIEEEYWDARGFFTRIEARVDVIKSAFDSETQENLESTLGTLRTELKTAAPPSDVAESLAALKELLSNAADA